MKQVQLNLVKNTKVNKLGEKFIYQGLYNGNFGNYYVFNLNQPYSLLVLTDKNVENVNFNLSDDQLIMGKSLSLVKKFAVSSILLHRARKVKSDYEDQAYYLSKNEDNLSLAAIVSGYAALNKDTETYVKTLSNIKVIKGDLKQTREKFKVFSKEVLALPTRDKYLGVLLGGTDAKVNGNNLYLGLRLNGSYRELTEALTKVEETFIKEDEFITENGKGLEYGILTRQYKFVGYPETNVVSYIISTDLSDKYTMGKASELNKELHTIVNLVSEFIVKDPWKF